MAMGWSVTVCRSPIPVAKPTPHHAWANRCGRACKMLFVLIDGKFDPEIGKHFG